MRPRTAALAALAVASVALAAWTPAAQAHGGVTDFVRETAGPYEVAFGTSPRTPSPGSPMHVSLRVIEAGSGLAVPGASVTMSGRVLGDGGAALESFEGVDADLYEEDPVFWDIDLAVERAGDWVFTVEVEGGPGEGAADFSVRVRDSSPVPGILTIVGLVAFLTVVALAMRTYLGARRARSGG